MTKNYRVIVTLKAPFCAPVEMPYGPAQPSKFQALSAVTSAMATHLDNDRWTAVQSIRIDVTDADATPVHIHQGGTQNSYCGLPLNEDIAFVAWEDASTATCADCSAGLSD